MKYYLNDISATLEALSSNESGLTTQQAQQRLAENGRNELAKGKKKSLIRRFIEQLVNPMVLILLASAAVSFVLAFLHEGSSEYAEAAIIMAVVIINSVLGVLQESKAEKAIEALQQMSAATARVRRDGEVIQIPAAELVVGDIVLLEAGDSVPADMRIIKSASLRIEEAALTGESVPVDKISQALAGEDNKEVSLGDRKNMAYMSSGVVYGRGEGVVTATGMDTEMGKIAGIIQATQEGETPLQRKLSQLSKFLTIVVLAICVLIFGVQIIRAGAVNADVIMPSFMLAVSLAVAAIPEGLAAVVTIVLSIGVTKMAKRNAVIRRLTAVETLGCTQVICSDKTGTLTQNKMTVTESYGDTAKLAKAMALCCDSHLSADGEIVGDPTENALVAFAMQQGLNKNDLEQLHPRVGEAPFDSNRKMMSTIHKVDQAFVQYTKGAPDEVLRVCTHALVDGAVVPMTSEIIEKIIAVNHGYAERALRVLACAYKNYPAIPSDFTPESLENDLIFIGLEAMIDPIRPEAKAAVEECKSAGIKIVMITGDHKDTATAIALELGIISHASQAMTGIELSQLSDEEFESRIENTFVYARVQPEHKVRIVNMWKKKGYITAMTGDGVNDAPAIKSGDIGIGMGITGTDVTKNVADMVLTDDNFASIVHAVEEGRRIYDNVRKTIQFLLGSNLSEVVAILVSVLMGFTLFKPIHLLFINLITDSIPAVALGVEPAQPGIMKRPPRGSKEGIFAGGLAVDIIYQGVVIAGLTLLSYFIVNLRGGSNELAMTTAFFTLSAAEIFHSYNMRSLRGNVFALKEHNKILWGAMVLSMGLTLAIIYIPPFARVFSLVPMGAFEIGVGIGLSLFNMVVVSVVKYFQSKA